MFKHFYLTFLALILITTVAHAGLFTSQDIRVQGQLKCIDVAEEPAVPVSDVLVIPDQYYDKSLLSSGAGLYHFTLPGTIADRDLVIYCRNANSTICKSSQWIQRSKIRRLGDQKVFYVHNAIVVDGTCESVLSEPVVMEKQLSLFREQPDLARDILESTTGVAAFVAEFVTLGAFGGAVPPPPGNAPVSVIDISPGQFKRGLLMEFVQTYFSHNPGFGVAPGWDPSLSVFTNSSALADYSFDNVSFNSDFNEDNLDYATFSAHFQVREALNISLGYAGLRQSEVRTGRLVSGEEVSESFEFRNQAFVLGLGAKVPLKNTRTFSVGAALKFFDQTIEIPSSTALIDQNIFGSVISWAPESRKNEVWDVDFSATLRFTNSVTVGANILSAFGTSALNSDLSESSQSSYGIGVNYEWARLELGSEIVYRSEHGLEAAVGVGLRTFWKTTLHVGYDTTYQTFSAKAQGRWLTLSVTDGDLFGKVYSLGFYFRF